MHEALTADSRDHTHGLAQAHHRHAPPAVQCNLQPHHLWRDSRQGLYVAGRRQKFVSFDLPFADQTRNELLSSLQTGLTQFAD